MEVNAIPISRQPRSGWRALAVVGGVQGAAIALTAVLALVPLWATLDFEAFQPYFYRFPLQASADASPPEVVREELASALPGARVELEGDSILLLGKRAELRTRVPFAVLTEHGHPPSTFSTGRVLDLEGGIRRTAASSAPGVAFMLLLQPLVFAAAGLLLRRRTIAPWPPRRGWPVSALVGVGAGLALALAFEVVVALLGVEIAEQPLVQALTRAGGVPLALLTIMAVMVAPVGEELFFRGWMFRYLDARIGRVVGYGGSALFFAVAHLHPSAFLVYVALGLAFAGLYAWSGSLWTPILAHATINLIAVAGMLG